MKIRFPADNDPGRIRKLLQIALLVTLNRDEGGHRAKEMDGVIYFACSKRNNHLERI